MRITDVFITLATIVMAIVSCMSCRIQKQSVDISSKLADIEEQNVKHNVAALKAEFRPYLIFILKPGDREELKSDENGECYFRYDNQNYFSLPFGLENKGKIPALNIKPKYDGYWTGADGKRGGELQLDVPIERAEEMGHFMPEGGSTKVTTYRPHINLQAIKGNASVEGIEVVLTVMYQGNTQIDDDRIYSAKLILRFEREEKDSITNFILKKIIEEYPSEVNNPNG